MTLEMWATASGSPFHVWVRETGGKVDAEFEFPATVKEAFGMLRHRGLEVESFGVTRGSRIRKRGTMPNPKRRRK